MTTTTEPDVHIVDDDAAVRDSLRELVESAGMQAATYESAEEFLETCNVDTRGCLVLDIRMSGMSGLDLQRILPDRECTLPAIVLTGHGDVPAATRAFKQGAVDYIQKPFDPPALLRCIRAAIEQDRQEREERAAQRDLMARVGTLSARARDVMDLVVAGLANKQIAARLGIAERTVEDHRARMMRALGVDSIAQLVRLATAYKR